MGVRQIVFACPAEILASLGDIKAASLRIDLSVGKYDSGFTELMRPNINGSQNDDIFNFGVIDGLADGLKAQRVGFCLQELYSECLRNAQH